jgi:diguanylate cyclase (GGDEF)-like protein
MNPKYNVKDFAEIEISLQQDKTYISINFFEDRREEEIEVEKRIETFIKQAQQDQLTGLLNRHGYWNKVENILKGKDPERELGIVMIDIDNLKTVNDTQGHLKGDESIKEVGDIILDSIRSRDIACRYGGDEFLIIVEEYTGRFSTAYGLAKRLRKRISKSKKAQTTISIGVHVVKAGDFSKYADDEEKLQEKWEEAIKIADEMAYKAKEKGKDRVECSENVKR